MNASDDLLKPLRGLYLAQLRERASTVETFLDHCREGNVGSGEREVMAHLAHKLAGSGTTYGYPLITQTARLLEQALADSLPVDGIAPLAESLAHACAQALLAIERESSDPAVRTAPPPSTVKPALLVIDDDPVIRETLGVLFGKDFEVLVASDGAAGLEVAVRRKPALVLVDQTMPLMSGVEFVTAFRATGDVARDTPVIMVTGKAGARDVVTALEAGISDYIVKPFKPAELGAKVRELLHRSGRTVLIADDDPAIRDLLAYKFRIAGVRVLTASDGEEVSSRRGSGARTEIAGHRQSRARRRNVMGVAIGAWCIPMIGARRTLAIGACALFTVAGAHATQRAATWTDLARHEAYSGRHTAALAATDSALAIAPDDFEARLLRARVLSWESRFHEADSMLTQLGREHPENPEVLLVTASLRYYQGRHAEAADAYRAVLRKVPDHGDAREGLILAERARDAAAEVPTRWRVDAGGDYSTFTRRSLQDWNQQFAQLSHRIVAADDRVLLTAHAKAERHERYELVDWSFEAGVHRDFSARLRTSLAGAWTPDAVFRPRWKLAAEGEWLGFSPEGRGASLTPSLWLLAGARYEVYSDASFIGLNPGARLRWGSGWAFTGSLSRVMERGAGATTGWALRADGVTGSPRLGPLRDNARFWFGVADAPETQVIAGATETVSTHTVFGGLGFDLTGGWSVMLGYARDDREGSWVRHAFNLGVAHAF